MKTLSHALPKLTLGLLLATGVAGAVAASAEPARAGVVVSVGFGGYASPYHWYRWHDYGGWHRRWVPVGWAPPAVYGPPGYLYRPGYVAAGYWRHDWGPYRHDWDRDHRHHWDRRHRDWR
jgi:hypothetical protein